MPDDLVQRLRSLARREHDDLSVGDEAGDEIERLQRQNDGLRSVHSSDSAELRSLCAARDEQRARANKAEAELAELQTRISNAPIFRIRTSTFGHIGLDDDGGVPVGTVVRHGQRVRLLAEDDQ